MIYTIGHSTRTHEEVFELLRRNGVDLLVDIRSYPSSRFCPQWNKGAIVDGLEGVSYVHFPILGGKRKPIPLSESRNGAWRNQSFRGYADYMQTKEFSSGLEDLMDLTRSRRSAIMCSESVWWKCHRSMVSDALVVRGVEVRHILSDKDPGLHSLRDFAEVNQNLSVHYPRK